MKNFFISYTSSDAKWAEWIAWELEATVYTVVVQLWDFHPGNAFIAEMERASREAGQTLAILSPRYFESRFTEAEWTAAFKKVISCTCASLISGRFGARPGLVQC